MAIFCIPQHLIETLKNSALKGEVDIKKLYDMSSKERREFFTSHTDENLGKFINTEFEKAVVSSQKNALLDWAKSVFTPKAQAEPVYKSILDKINNLDELGVLNPKTTDAFLEDLVSDKLGINVTPEQVRLISERATKIDEAQIALGDDIGNPLKLQENIDFFKAKKEMDDYLNNLTPAGKLRVLTSTIGRGMMLASVKSPLLNVGSNIEVGFTEALSRRIAEWAIQGADGKLATEYVKMANKIYQASGYDISRMLTLNDAGTSGQRVLGETGHAQGKGAIRRVGRFFEDTVFKQLMGAPDVAFSAAHFADSVNLNSLKLANGDKKLARSIMEDAMRLEPQTAEGEILRNQAILDAQTATWTNKTWASNVSEGIRKILNDTTGDLRAGDYLLPFVKTPANVIATGMDYAGLGIPKAILKTVKAIKAGKAGTREHFQNITRDLVRSGIGITAAFIIASQLKDDDFVGAYDPARAQIEGLRNSTENSFRIGDKWVSTNWLGPLAVPFTAMMYSRKYGKKGIGEAGYQYASGVAASIKEIPGVSDIFDYTRTSAYKKNQTLEEMTGETSNYIAEELSSRLVPSLFSDIAKATDKHDRQTKGMTGGFIPDTVINKIPGARQALPIKKNIFGEKAEGEPAWSDILFGARVKTDKENAIIKEINTVSQNADKAISFTDWSKSSSKTLAQFKQKVGEARFERAKTEYGQELKKQLESAFKTAKYKNLSDDEKATVIADQDAEAQKKIFAKYKFKYKPVKTKKVKI